MSATKRVGQRPCTSGTDVLLRKKHQHSNGDRNLHHATLGCSSCSSLLSLRRQCRHGRQQDAKNRSPAAACFLPEVACFNHPSLTSTATTTNTTSASGDSGKKTSACDSKQSVPHPQLAASRDSSSSELASGTLEEMEMRRNYEKCLTWVHSLPDKFCNMHIVQQTIFAASDAPV